MIFKASIIFAVLAVSVYSQSSAEIENKLVGAEPQLNCDSFFEETENRGLLEKFLQKNDLIQDYVERNDNFVTCMSFLEKFLPLLGQYRREEEQKKQQVEEEEEEDLNEMYAHDHLARYIKRGGASENKKKFNKINKNGSKKFGLKY